MLQSKAGYIDARPHIRQLDESSLATRGRTIHWVNSVGSNQAAASSDVCFAPKADNQADISLCPLSAQADIEQIIRSPRRRATETNPKYSTQSIAPS
jgi:hypothetical protein